MKRIGLRIGGVIACLIVVAGCGSAARPDAVAGDPGLDPDMAVAAPAVAPPGSPGVFGDVTWNQVGPVYSTTSGKLTAFAHDPTNPNVMYAGGSWTGIVGTTDGGKTWTRMDNGILDSSGYTATGTNALTVVASNPSTVLAATAQGIYRSTNSGGDWALVSNAKVGNAFTWVGATIYAATDLGVLASADGGATWTTSLALPAGASQATAITSVGSLVVVGFAGKVPLELLKNGTWTAATGVPAAGIHQIAVDPFNTSVIYIARGGGSYNYALSASTDGGNTWGDITYTELGAQMIAFSSVHPDRLYYGGDAGPVLYLDNAQTPPVVPATPTWGQGFVANGGNSDKQYILVEPNSAGTDDQCWVGSDQGLFYSSTCSARTNPTGAGLTGGLENFLVTDFAINKSGQGLVAQLQDYSSSATANGGTTWTSAGDSEDGAAAVNPGNDNWCYSWTRRSATGCATFTASTTTGIGQPTYDNGAFTFDPTNPNTLYIAGSTSTTTGGTTTTVHTVLKSTDGGITFADAGWGFTNATAVQVDPNNAQHIAVIAGGVLNQSSDGGATWTKSAQTGLVTMSYLAGYPGVVLAASSNTIYRSTDSGATFTATNITNAGGVYQIGCESGPTPLCAIGTNDQLLASADQGVTWSRIDQNTTTHKFTSVHWLDGYLYAGTYGQGIIKTSAPLEPAQTFVSTTPTRLLDTRIGVGAPGPVAANGTVSLQVTGGVVPAGASAVVLNVTVTDPTSVGNVTVYPDGTALPTASNLNFVADQTVPNLVFAAVGSGGKVDLHVASAGTAQLIADVSGYFTGGASSAPGTFQPVTPTRILDTRIAQGAAGAVAAHGTLRLQVAGSVVPSGATAAIINVTATEPQSVGYITAYPDGSPQPTASNLNFSPAETVPNLVFAPLGADGMVDLYNGSGGTTQLVADVAGYIRGGGAPTGTGTFVSTTPTRLLDTRDGMGAPGPVAGAGVVHLQVAGQGTPVPSGVTAVIVNVTVTDPRQVGNITVYPDGTSLPGTSNLNFTAGQTVANLVVAPVGANGEIDLRNASSDPCDLVADVYGYVN